MLRERASVTNWLETESTLVALTSIRPAGDNSPEDT